MCRLNNPVSVAPRYCYVSRDNFYQLRGVTETGFIQSIVSADRRPGKVQELAIAQLINIFFFRARQ